MQATPSIFWKRANRAANYIKNGKTHGRELDDAFEYYDGKEMCAAIYRIAQQDPLTWSALCRTFDDKFFETAHEFDSLDYTELAKHANQTQKDEITRKRGLNDSL